LYSTPNSPNRGGKDEKPNLCEKSVTHQSLMGDLSLFVALNNTNPKQGRKEKKNREEAKNMI
jgi:hypothetical protein